MLSVTKLATRCLILGCVLVAACGSDSTGNEGPGPDAGTAADAAPDGPPVSTDPCASIDISKAPTYSKLFADWFAVGKPGGCAASSCHGATPNGGWVCGTTASTCFNGMKGAGLIDTANPTDSLIASPTMSPLRWFNPKGIMPANNVAANDAGKAAIQAWVCAGAKNN